MASVPVRDDICKRLARRAAEERTTVKDLIEPALESPAGGQPRSTAIHESSVEERRKAFEHWMEIVRQRANRYPDGFMVDDGRENIYAERGE